MAGQNFKIGVDDKEALDAFTKLEKDARMFESTMVKLGDKIDNVFEATNLSEYKQAISSQISVVESLTKEYDNLVAKRDEWASKGVGNTFTNEEIKQQQAEYANFEKQLKRIDRELQSETKELEKQQIALQLIEKEYNKVSSKSVTYLTQLKNIREEMATMVDASGNVSTKDIDRYNELKGKLGELGTAYRRVQQEQKLVTQAGNSMVLGITQGLQAIAGTFTLIQGLSSLISSDSEDVAEAQKKLQQAMAITMGIQQVSTALHSTSALRIGLVSKATNLLTIAQNRLAIAFNGSTIAARAFMGAVTLGIGVAITAAIVAYNKYADAQEKAAQAAKELNEEYKGQYSSISKQIVTLRELQVGWVALGDNVKGQKQYLLDNAKAFEEYGVEADNVNKANDLLTKDTDRYIDGLKLRAKATANMALAEKAWVEVQSLRDSAKTRKAEADWWDNTKAFFAKIGARDAAKYGAVTQEEIDSITGLSFAEKAGEEMEEQAKTQEQKFEEYINNMLGLQKEADSLLGDYTPKDKKPKDKDANNEKKELDKLLLDQDKALAKDREELERSQIEGRIKMLQYEAKKRIEQIQAEKDAILKLNKDADVSIFEQREQIALEYYEKEIQKENEAQEEANRKSLDSFKSYYEQRQDIIDKYNKHIDVAESLGFSKESIQRIKDEMTKELSKLDFGEMMKTQDIGYLFEDLEKKSTDSIKGIISELKRLRDTNIEAWSVEELKIFNEQISKGENIARSRSPYDSLTSGIEKYKNATKEVESIQKQINVLDKTSIDYNEKLLALKKKQSSAMDTQTDAQKQINDAANEMGRNIKEASGAMGDAVEMLGNFGIEFNESINDTIKGIGQIGDSLASLDITKPMSWITSSIGVISGVGNTIASLFGSEKKISEETYRTFNNLIATLNNVIDKQKELISITAGARAKAETDKAIGYIEMQIEANKKLGKEYLDSGSSWKKHSKGVYMIRGLQAYRQEIEKAGIDLDELGGRGHGLFDLSPEQLRVLRRDAPTAWAKLDDEARKYLESIIESDDAINEMNASLQETLTGQSFEGFLDSIMHELRDFKGDIKDFADFTEETIADSLVNAYKQTILRDEMKQWYDSLSNILSEDISNLSESDFDAWSEGFQKALEQQEKDFAEKLKKLGIDVDKQQIEPPKASKGYQVTASQDSVDEVLGIARNMQMIGLNQEQELIKQTEILSTFGNGFVSMQQELQGITSITLESMYYLRDIEKHTKTLNGFGEILTKIEKNTQ